MWKCVGCCLYGSSVFCVFAITERSEMGLYDVPMFMSLLDFGIGMMFASFHIFGIMLYMRVQAVRYV